jgi:cell division protein FtsI/penicillin-binding protein 2
MMSTVVMDVASGEMKAEINARVLARPGSTVKPFTLLALGNPGARPCTRPTRIAGRNFDCSHGYIGHPLSAAEALAYSCNSWFAGMAEQVSSADLSETFRRAGLDEVNTAKTLADVQLQALGEDHVRVTPHGLARAYRSLALRRKEAALERLFVGLRGAVEYGTARLADSPKVRIAGKTGTATSTIPGKRHAWFCGFAPEDAPRIVVVMFVEQGSGGADAAPLAREVIEAWYARR